MRVALRGASRFTFHCFTAGDLEFLLGFVLVCFCLGLVALFVLLSTISRSTW